MSVGSIVFSVPVPWGPSCARACVVFRMAKKENGDFRAVRFATLPPTKARFVRVPTTQERAVSARACGDSPAPIPPITRPWSRRFVPSRVSLVVVESGFSICARKREGLANFRFPVNLHRFLVDLCRLPEGARNCHGADVFRAFVAF